MFLQQSHFVLEEGFPLCGGSPLDEQGLCVLNILSWVRRTAGGKGKSAATVVLAGALGFSFGEGGRPLSASLARSLGQLKVVFRGLTQDLPPTSAFVHGAALSTAL